MERELLPGRGRHLCGILANITEHKTDHSTFALSEFTYTHNVIWDISPSPSGSNGKHILLSSDQNSHTLMWFWHFKAHQCPLLTAWKMQLSVWEEREDAYYKDRPFHRCHTTWGKGWKQPSHFYRHHFEFLKNDNFFHMCKCKIF